MKKVTLVVTAAIIISFLLPPYSYAFLDEPDSFRGIEWGTDIKKLRGMKLAEKHNAFKYYIRKSDKLKMGNADLKSISYGFNDDSFYFACIRFNSDANFSSLKNTFSEEHGPCVQNNDECAWRGKDVNIILKYNEKSHKGKIYYYYKPLSPKEDGDKNINKN